MGKTNSFLGCLLILTILTGCAAPKSIAGQVPEPEYWPTSGWKSSTPEAQGMDSELLAGMIEDISAKGTRIHSVLIIRNGYLVTEAYFHPYARDTKIHVQSVTKSVMGALVGIAIKKGYIKSVDETLLSFFPGRVNANPSSNKDSIRLKHLLSMSSGFPCQEFSNSGQSMEQAAGWAQFMLDLPVDTPPGQTFGYCDGNPHLLSVILEKTTGMTAREFANQELFQPIGIPPVGDSDWWTDPRDHTNGGYGLFLKPVDLAKFALLYLRNGEWDNQQILPVSWVADSTTPYVQKPEGPGYGYFWTVYPDSDRYSALGLAGQQIHVYPLKNLIVIVTAELETFVEAPEIEKMLREYVLPSIRANDPVAGNPAGDSHLQAAIETAANPVRPVPSLPVTALDISGSTYTFKENPMGWETLEFDFEEEAETARLYLSNFPVLEIGMDNLYRLSSSEAVGELLLRGRWVDEQTFVIDYPFPAFGAPTLGELGETEFQFKFTGDNLEVGVQQLIFGGEAIVFEGSR